MTTQAIPIEGVRFSAASPAMAARWLLLLVFPLGYAATQAAFPGVEYAALNVLSALTMAVLLARLSGDVVADMAGLIILTVFVVGYYGKFYAAEWVVLAGAPWSFDPSFEDAARSHTLALEAFRLFTYGWIACVLTWSFGPRMRVTPKIHDIDPPPNELLQRATKHVFTVVIPAIAVFMVVSGVAQYVTGVGVMGSENVALPYHLAGIIFHPREKTLPVIIAFLAWLAWVHDVPRLGMTALGILVLHAVAQSFLQASRGQLVYAFLPIMVLWVVRRELTSRRWLAIGGVLAIAAVLHPLITALRILRLLGQPLTWQTLVWARANIDNVIGDQGLNALMSGLLALFARVSGSDVVLVATQYPYTNHLSLAAIQHFFFNPQGLTHARVMTMDVFGYTELTITVAPTLVGSGVVIGGAMGVIALCVLWTGLMTAILDYVASRPWRIAQFAWAIAVTWAFNETSGFVLLTHVQYPVFWGGGVVLCALILHRFIPVSTPGAERAAVASG